MYKYIANFMFQISQVADLSLFIYSFTLHCIVL
jgi:hypothetical protein